MFPFPSRSSAAEWPKLDLRKHHLSRLALAWAVPYSPEAEEEFAPLLDVDGSFTGVLSYSRGRVRHYRIEAAQIGLEDDDALLVTVQYQADIGDLGEFPKLLEEGAWLLEPLQNVEVASPVVCHVDFDYGSSPTLATAVPLPLHLGDHAPSAAYDEIVGVRGVKYAAGGDVTTGYSFTLDRQPNHDIALSLQFARAPGAPAQMPELVLKDAAEVARGLVLTKGK